MSANNFLLISGTEGNYDLVMYNADAEIEDSPLMDYGIFNTLEMACKKAHEIMISDTVEYGIHFNLK